MSSSRLTNESNIVRLPSFHELNDIPVAVVKVVPNDWIDFMGHMNVMWYTHLFSQAAIEFFKTVGLTPEYFIENTAGSFVIEQHIRYIAEVREGETISVRTRPIGRSEKKLHFQVFLVKEEAQLLASTSELVTIHIDMSCRRSSPLPNQVAMVLDSLVERYSKLPWSAPGNGFTHC